MYKKVIQQDESPSSSVSVEPANEDDWEQVELNAKH